MRGVAATHRLATPPGVGAVAVIDLVGDVEGALRAIGTKPAPVGSVALREIAGVDTGLVARWSESHAQLMPHAGAYVVAAVLDALERAGVARAGDDDPCAIYPEAEDVHEARMLDALSRAHSPLAVDLLLAQPARWRAWDGAAPPETEIARVSESLNRLIDPPTVVAVGGTNIGKSTLVNALARRAVSIVADEPGATRDHVGALVDLAGLVVRWIDTPGVREGAGEAEREAARIARVVADAADLLVLCADARTPFVQGWGAGRATIRVGLRADLGPAEGAETSVSAAGDAPEGLERLALAVRERLMPASVLAWEGPWRFWRGG